ncbi:uncharacterized protein LTR77_008496 [Saxophila tyrrhenica]|uniref:TM7S3/TM198-like domain-containing protein n=1 Tax=Saxophila tyrrhenica TaxID=1690608 RepID=A0AAV9P1K7_9PEZI|nr:hypothetical protein LTR77_008496 [Saxophila tyrrhenica]
MYFRGPLTAALLALCCAHDVVGRAALHPRQDGGTSTPATTTDGGTVSSTQSVTSTAQSSQTTEATTRKTTDDEQPTRTARTSTESTLSTTSTSESTSPTAHHNTTAAVDKADELPIQPEITPALGIAGVVLMLTGAAYAIIGIKHQWLNVFFSAAYLTSLSVTVLIIYVMSPPVSDAIQGAYMVAALLTGLIFGAISLVFKEVTEGLGCLLGGFCLSMWFLMLKPGSLISSTTGRAIMIGVFCVVGWSLSFSQYTRTYGVIGSTAFAGAMITVLGIDCFSRAGLKEFWMYIWALNKNVFPLHTNTYPITRGIRVEIAATIIIFLFGVMSQIKIWKIVRERKARSEEAKEAEASRRDQRDSAIGKTIERNNGRSLALWEGIYGNKDKAYVHPDSGVGTSVNSGDHKKSVSVATRELGSIEMDDMGGVHAESSSKSQRHPVLVRTGTDEEMQHEDPNTGNPMNLDPEERQWWEDFQSTKTKSRPGTVRSVDEGSLNEMLPSDRQHAPGGPEVVSLPFLPPAERSGARTKSAGSAASKAEAAQEQTVNERRGVALNKLALAKLDQNVSSNVPRIDDDRASSVAATADDDRSMKRQSLAPTIQLQSEGLSPFSDEFKADAPKSSRTFGTPGTPIEDPMDENDDEMVVRSPPLAVRPVEEGNKEKPAHKQKRRDSAGSRRRSTSSAGAAHNERDSASQSEDAASVHSLKRHLPESISKVAMAYRTNEWAKHIANADQPMYEEALVDEAGVQVEVGRPVEQPRPLDPAALSETAPPEVPNLSSNPSFRQSKSVQEPRRKSSSGPTPVYAFSRAGSYQSLQRQGSSNSVNQQKRDTRNASAPVPTLVESPIEEDQATSGPYQSSTPFASTSNLLDERNTRLSRRTTTTSFNALASQPSLNIQAPTPEPGRTPGPPLTEVGSIPGEEDLTLSERKALIDQGAISPPSRHRQSSNPTPPRASNSHIYDSHQPRRTNTVDMARQSAMLSQWRQSLQQNTPYQPVGVAEEQARQAMLSQREHAGAKRQKELQRRESRDSRREVAMRTGQLAGAHQEAMRRMQAKANESVAGKE